MSDPRVFVLITVLLGGMGQGVVAPKLPELLGESSQLLVSSGISATLMYFGIFVSTFHFGRLADRGYVHWLTALGLVGYGISLLTLGLVHSIPLIFSTRFLEGLALSAVYVAADFVLGRLSEARSRGQWLSYYGVALSAGLLFGPLLALATAHWSASPMLALGIVATIAGVLAIPAFWAIRVPRAEAGDEQAVRLQFGPLVCGAVYGYMEAGLVAVFPAIATRELHVLPELCLVIVIVSAALSSLAWGHASDRFGSRTVVMLLVRTLFVGSLVIAALGSRLVPAHLAYFSSIFFGLLAGGLYPVGFAWLLEGTPESQYGFASGSFARAYGVGSLMGPLAAGASAEWLGSTGMFLAMSLAAAAGLIIVAFSRLRSN